MRAPGAPALEMLWEYDDPQTVLADRFGLAGAAEAAAWVAATVRDHWDVRVDSCERIVISDRNALAWVTTPAGRLLAKWSVAPQRFARLAQVAGLTHWLAERGLPVSAPVLSSDGRPQVEVDGVSMGLQRVVDAELLDVAHAGQVRAVGAALARLHEALGAYPETDAVLPEEEAPAPVGEHLAGWLDSAGEHVPAAGVQALRRMVDSAPSDPLPTQLLHGDFRSSNVLCAGTEVAAVLDFEELRVGPCVDELARSAVMLGTRFRDWGPVSADVRAAFLSGYRSVRPLPAVEEAWWEILVLWYSLALVPQREDPTGWGAAALSHVEDLAIRPA